MTSRRSASAALLGLAILPMLALAGCSTSTPAPAATSHAATPAAATTPTPSATTPAHVKGTPITTGDELCTLATAAEATSALGTSEAFAELSPQDTTDGPVCAYSGAGISPSVLVSLLSPQGGGITKGLRTGLPLTSVPDLGQQAGVADGEVDVILGGQWLEVFNNDPTVPISHDQLVAFATLLVGRY